MGDTHRVMTTLILVVLVLLMLELKRYCGVMVCCCCGAYVPVIVEFSLQSDRCIPVNYRAQWIEKSKKLMLMSVLTKDSTFQEIQEP